MPPPTFHTGVCRAGLEVGGGRSGNTRSCPGYGARGKGRGWGGDMGTQGGGHKDNRGECSYGLSTWGCSAPGALPIQGCRGTCPPATGQKGPVARVPHPWAKGATPMGKENGGEGAPGLPRGGVCGWVTGTTALGATPALCPTGGVGPQGVVGATGGRRETILPTQGIMDSL